MSQTQTTWKTASLIPTDGSARMSSELQDQLQSALGDAYRLERELGGGGMSRVFVAHERALDRSVVVKVLPPELTGSLSLDRFRREIRLAARVHHPHIIPILLVGQANGLMYYTMPYIEGESLRARLEREGQLPIRDVIRIMRDVADALSHAHALGVVHRDIKPDNVLLVRHHAILTDFGVAKALRQSRESGERRVDNRPSSGGMALGTPEYMAPEQVAADPTIDHRADIYALGCFAYEMLTGKPPFTDRSAQKVLAAHMAEIPSPVSEGRAGVPFELERIVMRCLEKDPDDRWRDTDDLTDELNTLMAETVLTTGVHPIALQRITPVRAIGSYLSAVIVVAAGAQLVRHQLGLDTWVQWGAMLVMALGFPVVLLTALVHRKRAGAGRVMRAARRVFTWRTTALGGWVAIGLFAVGVAIYAVVR